MIRADGVYCVLCVIGKECAVRKCIKRFICSNFKISTGLHVNSRVARGYMKRFKRLLQVRTNMLLDMSRERESVLSSSSMIFGKTRTMKQIPVSNLLKPYVKLPKNIIQADIL